ncbi:electron transport complex subunit RsxG [Vibrio sp. 99-8-1]|uniref:electron transport complex subunit RsxG n=1 Tax=Vibrio sp. 99-8-1 TaxID=2607602 RepID=UPI0014935DD7|nr:electron transport complex subunit RsxG [Vibrio sp. 99-8-1]NOI68479.1 electron transport complex subunit RsxG [Vibrio sp. 99-8-1]
MLTAMKKNGATLAIFACACTGLVAVTQYLTKDTIHAQEVAQLKTTLNQVVPHQMHDNELYKACTLVKSDLLGSDQALHAYIGTLSGQNSAIAIEAIAPDGYNGKIKLIVGLDNSGTVTGTRVLAHNETPGLGDKIDSRVSDWISVFKGKQVTDSNLDSWQVRKDGGEFDQFTGATITPRAVVKAVKNTILYFNQNRDAIYSQTQACGGNDE